MARGRLPSGHAADQEAQSAIKAAQAALAAARQQLMVLQAESAAARARVAQAKADLETAHLNLGYTEIRSPVDGYIGNRAGEAGAYVASGAYLLSVIPVHGVWVDANFKEDQLAQMRPGQPATVVTDVLPGKVFPGSRAEPGAGDRCDIQCYPAAERHRQFHQDRPARAGAHRSR